MKALIDTVLSQDGFVYNCIGLWSRFNKSSDGVNDIDVGLVKIMEGKGTNNQIVPSLGASSGPFMIIVDVGMLL